MATTNQIELVKTETRLRNVVQKWLLFKLGVMIAKQQSPWMV
jgi:hypothetical protein